MPFTWMRPEDSQPVVSPASVDPAAVATEPVPGEDHATVLQRAKAAELLVRLFEYFDANAEHHPALAAALPVLSSAVAEHRTGQAEDPFAGVRRVLDEIQSIRAADPSVPDA